MSKIELNTSIADYGFSQINANFQLIEDELNQKVLYRDNPVGEPNSMTSTSLDMNGNKIFNLPEPLSPSEPARLQDLQGLIEGPVQANLIGFTPSGTISANTVQGAIQELDTETQASFATQTANLNAHITDTTDAHNSLAITYEQAGTGIVSRTVQSRLREQVHATDFGASSALASNTAAVQAAIDYIFTLPNGGELILPPETLTFATKLSVPKDTSKAFVIRGQGASSKLRGGTGFTGPLIEVGLGSSAAGGVEYEFKDFMIAAPVSGTCTGIKLINANTMRLHGIKMQLVTLGVQLDSCFAIRMTECLFDTLTQNAIYSSTASHNLVIEGCRFYSVGGVTFQTIQIDVATDNIVINGCDFEQCFGVYGLTSPTALRITGNYIEFCVGAEFNHNGAATGWECHGNWIALNTQATTTWANINGGSFCNNTLFGQNAPTFLPMNVAWGSNVKDVDVGTNIIKGTATLAATPFNVVSSYQNGYATGARTVSYSRAFDGRVTLRGVMTAGTPGATAFVLPVGYRPVQQEWFCTVGGGNALAVVIVDTNGNVVPQTAPAASVAVDGISFICKSTV